MSWILLTTALIIPLASYFSFGRAALHLSHHIIARTSLKDENLHSRDINQLINSTSQQFSLTQKVFLFIFGFTAHLVLVFCAYHLGLAIKIAFWGMYLLMLGVAWKQCFKDLLSYITWPFEKKYPDISFSCYFFVVVAIGVSLFDADQGVRTIWMNNYSDSMFHFSLILNYALGKAPLSQYPIYPGELLSYPVLMDFWSACLWYPDTGWKGLSLVFAAQWTIIWLAAFFLLRGALWGILPWTLLFAGGSFTLLFTQAGVSIEGLSAAFLQNGQAPNFSHMLIDKGYPFTVLLTTVWIPQRTSILGMILCLSVMCLALELIRTSEKSYGAVIRRDSFLLLGGILAGLALLTHFHIAAGTGFFLVLILLFDARASLRAFIVFSVSAALFSLPALLMYASKSGMLTLTYGWMSGDSLSKAMALPLSAFITVFGLNPGEPGVLASLIESPFVITVAMWILNASLWILAVLLLGRNWRFRYLLPVVILFILQNIVQLSAWSWDNIKFLLAILLIIIALARHSSVSEGRESKSHFFLYLFFVLLTAPAIFEIFTVLRDGKFHQIYSNDVLEQARSIRENTPHDAIIAGAPDHSSPVIAAGRIMFVGYPGWLWTHAINYQEREKINKNLESLLNCESESHKVCPNYIFDSNHGAFWGTNLRQTTRQPAVPDHTAISDIAANKQYLRSRLRALGDKGLYEIIPVRKNIADKM